MQKIQWINSNQTLLRVGKIIYNMAIVTQIVLEEDLDTEIPAVAFYTHFQFDDVITLTETPPPPDCEQVWVVFEDQDAEDLREFFGYSATANG